MKLSLVVVLMAAALGMAGLAHACETCGCQLAKASDHGHEHAAVADIKAAAPVLVNAGNTVCPIMGGAVSVDSPNKVEYKGKLYNLCCGGCKEAFLKDPEAALKKLSDIPVASGS